MDSDNLRTAATYINNLLLARGLLRNGTPIDFTGLAKGPSFRSDDQENRPPEKTGSKKDLKNSETNSTTTAHVLNLVHDLILRRDRDQAHLESLSATLSSLRLDASQHNQQLERANSKAKDAQRQVALHDASARVAKNAARSAEASARKLRDEVQKVKAVLVQVRAQHDKDIKKRDIEYHKLKQLVHAQQRGANPAPPPKSTSDAYTIVDGKFGQNHRIKLPHDMQDRLDHADPDYAVRSEGKEFLAELSKGLSDENEALLALTSGTLNTLRELMGMEHNQPAGLKTLASSDDAGSNDSASLAPVMSCAQLEKNLHIVLSSIRDLLTNPSFAPIEEVHLREEEIQRLREGWVMMEERWKEAVDMMQGWRKKMSGGHNIEMEELRMGLRLGEGVQMFASSPMRPLGEAFGLAQLHSDSVENMDDSFGADRLPETEAFEVPDDPLLKELGDLTISTNFQADSTTIDRHRTNVDDQTDSTSRRVKFTRSDDVAEVDNAAARIPTSRRPKATTIGPRFMRPTSAATNKQGAKVPLKQNKANKQTSAKSLVTSRNRAIEVAPEPVLTVREKLKLAEEEARRASTSSPLPTCDPISPPSSPLELNAVPPELEDAEQRGQGTDRRGERDRSPLRRTKVRGLPRRRRSTLSPEELEELLMGTSTGTETF